MIRVFISSPYSHPDPDTMAERGMSGPLSPVECGNCGWTGRRKPGNLVQCPKCGAFASYQELIK